MQDESPDAGGKPLLEANGQESNASTPDLPTIYAVEQSLFKQLKTARRWITATTLFCCFAILFTYAVFISDKPLPRAFDWSPSTTILLVNIASQVAALLITFMIGAVFDVLRWFLASRSKGTTLATFQATQSSSDLLNVGKLCLIRGTHLKWCVMRFITAAVSWGLGLLLLSQVTTNNVYNVDNTFSVIAGLADLHTSVQTLINNGVLDSTNRRDTRTPFQETAINLMISSTTRSMLTDPTFAIDVTPQHCEASDCKSIFLPGGLELVRQPNGTALDLQGTSLQEPVIIVNNAAGYQLDFSSSNYSFDRTTECNMTGFAMSSFYFCLVFTGETIVGGFSICPFYRMKQGTCLSDTSWTDTLDATVSLALYQRIATVAYDKSNFSILSIESISNAKNATNESLVADFQTMFEIMYPQLDDIVSELVGLITDPDAIWYDLAYWSSAYCVQSELLSAQWLLENEFPTMTTGKQDILESLMTIPIQFGTLLWQFVDIKTLPPALRTTASSARVTYRARSELWPLILFAALVAGLIVWAMICLLYIHYKYDPNVKREPSEDIRSVFKDGNPYEVDHSTQEVITYNVKITHPEKKDLEKKGSEKGHQEEELLVATHRPRV